MNSATEELRLRNAASQSSEERKAA
jgi:hypothetical protein